MIVQTLGDIEAVHLMPTYVVSAVCKSDCKIGTITRIVLNRRYSRCSHEHRVVFDWPLSLRV